MRRRTALGLLIAVLVLTGVEPVAAQVSVPAAPGSVVWYDLLTEDAGAVLDFYRGLFGWEISEQEPGAWIVTHGGRPIAGISEIADELAEQSEAFWLVGLAVADVDASISRARELGATVRIGPKDLPGYARYVVIVDPQGAPVLLLDPEIELGGARGHGAWVWTELWSDDLDQAADFYRSVVGLERHGLQADGGGYQLLRSHDRARAGLVPTPAEEIEPSWAPYVAVTDLAATLQQAGRLGGRVLLEPQAVSIGSVALLADPSGAAFFVFERRRGAEVKP